MYQCTFSAIGTVANGGKKILKIKNARDSLYVSVFGPWNDREANANDVMTRTNHIVIKLENTVMIMIFVLVILIFPISL